MQAVPDFKRILVAVDCSQASIRVLTYATRLAQKFDATIDVLYVVHHPGLQGLGARVRVANEERRKMDTQLLAQAEKELLQFLEMCDTPDELTFNLRYEWGRPHQAILEVALADAFDLIVMGTHGKTGISRFLLGSEADRVVTRAPCPVLTVRNLK